MTSKQKNLIVRTITGILFVAVMVSGFLNAMAMMLLFCIITGLTLWEYTGLVNNYVADTTVNRFISTVGGVYLFIAVGAWASGIVTGFAVLVPYILTIIYLLISELYTKSANAVADWAYTMLGQLYIALPYCVGSLIGKHKLFPRISPGKTWEGSIGGGVIAIIAAGIIGYLVNNSDAGHLLNVWEWLGLAVIVVVFGTWGDLVESLFKRTIGIKDSGNILPGHGGMMDRFDSSLMAIPAAVIYLYALQLFA